MCGGAADDKAEQESSQQTRKRDAAPTTFVLTKNFVDSACSDEPYEIVEKPLDLCLPVAGGGSESFARVEGGGEALRHCQFADSECNEQESCQTKSFACSNGVELAVGNQIDVPASQGDELFTLVRYSDSECKNVKSVEAMSLPVRQCSLGTRFVAGDALEVHFCVFASSACSGAPESCHALKRAMCLKTPDGSYAASMTRKSSSTRPPQQEGTTESAPATATEGSGATDDGKLCVRSHKYVCCKSGEPTCFGEEECVGEDNGSQRQLLSLVVLMVALSASAMY